MPSRRVTRVVDRSDNITRQFDPMGHGLSRVDARFAGFGKEIQVDGVAGQ